MCKQGNKRGCFIFMFGIGVTTAGILWVILVQWGTNKYQIEQRALLVYKEQKRNCLAFGHAVCGMSKK